MVLMEDNDHMKNGILEKQRKLERNFILRLESDISPSYRTLLALPKSIITYIHKVRIDL